MTSSRSGPCIAPYLTVLQLVIVAVCMRYHTASDRFNGARKDRWYGITAILRGRPRAQKGKVAPRHPATSRPAASRSGPHTALRAGDQESLCRLTAVIGWAGLPSVHDTRKLARPTALVEAHKGRIPGARANRRPWNNLVHSTAVAEQATMQAMEGLLQLFFLPQQS